MANNYELLDEEFDDADDGLVRDGSIVLLPRRIIQLSSAFAGSGELTHGALADRLYVPARNRSERAAHHKYRINIIGRYGRRDQDWTRYLTKRYRIVRDAEERQAAELAAIAEREREYKIQNALIDAEAELKSLKVSNDAMAWYDYFWKRICETRYTTWGEIEAERLTKQWRRDWEAQRQEALLLDAQIWKF